jgi:citrate synthase
LRGRSAVIAPAIGFPTSMFTVLSTVARTVGWVAQWKEIIEDPTQRIGRARQLYTGYGERPFVQIEKRK